MNASFQDDITRDPHHVPFPEQERIAQAFTAAFKEHKGQLYYFILKATNDAAAARDILQDGFLRLWENRFSIDWWQQDIRPLLFSCIRHLIIDHARKKNRRLLLTNQIVAAARQEAVSPEIEQSFDALHRRRQLDDFLSLLPEKRKKVFRMIKEEDLSHKEVAEKLGLSLSDVKKQISLSLRGLRKEMQL